MVGSRSEGALLSVTLCTRNGVLRRERDWPIHKSAPKVTYPPPKGEGTSMSRDSTEWQPLLLTWPLGPDLGMAVLPMAQRLPPPVVT